MIFRLLAVLVCFGFLVLILWATVGSPMLKRRQHKKHLAELYEENARLDKLIDDDWFSSHKKERSR